VAPVGAQTSQSFIFRHCLRQSADEAKHAKEEFPLLSDYTSHPLPNWGVPEDWCTQGGLKVSASAGADLKNNFGVHPSRMSMTADLSMRDGDTAVAFLTGMGAACAVEYDPILYSTFDPEAGEPVCPEPDVSVVAADIKARFAEVPLPWELEVAISEFEDVFGVGPAGSVRELGNISVAENGNILGPVNVLKELSQNLLYSTSSGIDYLNATYEQKIRFYSWQAYYRSVKDVGTEKAVESAYLLSRVLDDLLVKKDHSTLHFGHDGNQDGIAAVLGLEWEAPPFLGGKLVPTPPNSAIRLVHDHANQVVTASFIYLPFDTDVSSAGFAESPISSWSTSEFKALAMDNLGRYAGARECFDQAPKSQELSHMLTAVVV